MGKTSIEWSEHSINPLRARLRSQDGELQPVVNVGHYCEKVSPGCKNCYSSAFQPRFGMPPFQEQRRLDVEHWLDSSKLVEVLKRKKPTKYFWCDMTDMFGEWVSFEHIATCFRVMALTPHHVHQVLTKRPLRAAEWFRWASGQQGAEGPLHPRAALHIAASRNGINQGPSEWMPGPWPLPQVWLGTSVENRAAKCRIDELRDTPAAVRFLSLEPLLEDLGTLDLRGIDWVIVGGESGPGARSFDVAWAEDIVQQCRGADVACFVKQLGRVPYDSRESDRTTDERHPGGPGADPSCRLQLVDRKGADMSEWPDSLRVRQFPEVRA
jgi:protein gp37